MTEMLAPTDQRWQKFVATMPNANIFHHHAWLNLLETCYGYRSFVIVVPVTQEMKGIVGGESVTDAMASLKCWAAISIVAE